MSICYLSEKKFFKRTVMIDSQDLGLQEKAGTTQVPVLNKIPNHGGSSPMPSALG